MYNVSVSPHIRSKNATSKIMLDVAIALFPTLAFGVYHFGPRALGVIVLCVLSSVLSELLFNLISKKKITIFDCSAYVTGLILAVNLPSTVPWYVPVLGGAFAIIVVKLLFGGLGQNFMNPALAARCFLLISFASQMSNFQTSVDAVSTATPLVTLSQGEKVDLLQLFLGFHAGCIGEVSALAILIGALYLIVKKVISVRIPFSYIISTVVFITIIRLITGDGVTANYLLGEVLSGGLLVGAFFMATDYVTSPITPKGQIIYGIILGLLTALFRVVGSSAEGVSYAIIIGNLIVALVEKVTVPKPFGSEKAKEAVK
jgi:RnfABCDGE-type electron transport complex D subunit